MFYKYGIIPLNNIFEAIIKLAPPNDIIQVRKCFGLIDYKKGHVGTEITHVGSVNKVGI